jgi:hypothetical protein
VSGARRKIAGTQLNDVGQKLPTSLDLQTPITPNLVK